MKSQRKGFALLVVLFLLFAVGVSAAATYQMARTEVLLSTISADAQAAGAIAQAGLMRYIGEAPLTGELDSVEYAIEYEGANGFSPDGVAQISARKIMDDGSSDEIYRIHSVGRVTNRRFFESPTVREVTIYARREMGDLLTPLGGLVTTATSVLIGARFTVTGTDAYSGGTAGCPSPANLAGSTAAGNSSSSGTGSSLSGSPANNNQGSMSGVLNDLNLPPWAAVTDATLFPVDYEYPSSSWPNFAAIPSSTYPTTRVTGNLTANSSRSGRGLLIVTGTLTLSNSFTWQGVILAGSIANASGIYGTTIYGMLVGGISTSPGSLSLSGNTGILGAVLGYPSIRYHSCYVDLVNAAVGTLNVEPLSWWSGY